MYATPPALSTTQAQPAVPQKSCGGNPVTSNERNPGPPSRPWGRDGANADGLNQALRIFDVRIYPTVFTGSSHLASHSCSEIWAGEQTYWTHPAAPSALLMDRI